MEDIVFEQNDALEIMEFCVGKNVYGINIAKIKEVVQYTAPTPSPDQNPCVEGILMLRGNAIPIINLSKRLSTEDSTNKGRDLFIITNFNNLTVGLHVHQINGIRKIAWSSINPPDETLIRHGNHIITGIVNFKDYILVLLDFEKIVADINPVTTIQVKDVKTSASENNTDVPILIVDDSMMLSGLIAKSLKKAGYKNLIIKNNGKEAWDYLNKIDDKSNLNEFVRIVITDIEMPIMDGITLCENIKKSRVLNSLPVILFSSIANETMAKKCDEAGADAVLSKPEIDKLVTIIEAHL